MKKPLKFVNAPELSGSTIRGLKALLVAFQMPEISFVSLFLMVSALRVISASESSRILIITAHI